MRGSLHSWSELAQVSRSSATFVDEELVSNNFDSGYTIDDVPNISGIHQNDASAYEHVASVVLDLLPIFSTVKSVLELFTGRDLLTNEEIPTWVAAGGVIGSFLPGGKGAVKGVSKVVSGVSKIENKMYKAFERQFKEHGRKSLEKSKNNLQKRLQEHEEKLISVIENKGFKSSIEREIRTFNEQLDVIESILKKE